ncbi:MAG: hypothetical protein JKX70_08530 [Phycisphaerales bacterium]|nr:hypothetical protein [Phycisphaerales bacterium]
MNAPRSTQCKRTRNTLILFVLVLIASSVIGVVLNATYIYHTGWVPRNPTTGPNEFVRAFPNMEDGSAPSENTKATHRDEYRIFIYISTLQHPTLPDTRPTKIIFKFDSIKRDHRKKGDNEPRHFSVTNRPLNLPDELHPDALAEISKVFLPEGHFGIWLKKNYNVSDYRFTFGEYVSNEAANPLVKDDYRVGAILGLKYGSLSATTFYILGYWLFYRWFIVHRRQLRRQRDGLCIRCTYPMQADLCTECGYRSVV